MCWKQETCFKFKDTNGLISKRVGKNNPCIINDITIKNIGNNYTLRRYNNIKIYVLNNSKIHDGKTNRHLSKED